MNVVLCRTYYVKVKILRECFQIHFIFKFPQLQKQNVILFLLKQKEEVREAETGWGSLCTKLPNINQPYTTNIGKMGDCHIPLRQKISLVYSGINNRFQIQVKTIINKPNKVKKKKKGISNSSTCCETKQFREMLGKNNSDARPRAKT